MKITSFSRLATTATTHTKSTLRKPLQTPSLLPATPPSTQKRSISLPISSTPKNRHLPSLRRPTDVHTLLQSSSASSTLLLLLFTTSTCHSCRTITPLLSDLVTRRPAAPMDKFQSIAFAELELDSPEREDDSGGRGWNTMYDVGIEYGVRSVPCLMGFGGRRAERMTDRIARERELMDGEFMRGFIDRAMQEGDPHPSQGEGLFARIFGGGR